ncbi:hypothetical protein [Carboxylicivirga sp. N1Y90]|uniref:hypothetical protein n=1 Tax=Carboxylicivirga fragile TaxID=3417571 RepID=UPI003D347C0E|nr:hypothetical protein [Marinilabiliaceae bacterium N1Y90]
MSIEYYQISDRQVFENLLDLENIEHLSFHYKDENAIVLKGSEVSSSVLFQLRQTDFLFVVANFIGGHCVVQYHSVSPFIKERISQLELIRS